MKHSGLTGPLRLILLDRHLVGILGRHVISNAERKEVTASQQSTESARQSWPFSPAVCPFEQFERVLSALREPLAPAFVLVYVVGKAAAGARVPRENSAAENVWRKTREQKVNLNNSVRTARTTLWLSEKRSEFINFESNLSTWQWHCIIAMYRRVTFEINFLENEAPNRRILFHISHSFFCQRSHPFQFRHELPRILYNRGQFFELNLPE